MMSKYERAIMMCSDYALIELNQRMLRLGSNGPTRAIVLRHVEIRWGSAKLPIVKHPAIIEERIQKALKRKNVVDPLQGKIPAL